jgi:hypothetical protein
LGVDELIKSGSSLDAQALAGFSREDVPRFFKIPLGVSELEPLVNMIQVAITTCGIRLQEKSFQDFAGFVTSTLHNEASAAHLVEQLVITFPEVYDDRYKYVIDNHNVDVFLHKKVQLTTAELYHFHAHRDPLFKLKDIKEMTVYIDNVIPATLVKSGVLVLDEKLHQMIHGREHLSYGSDYEIELRAVALCATEQLIKESGNAYDSLKLGYYLWGILGKEKEYRSFERHATNTIMY